MGAGSGHRLRRLPCSSGPEEGGALFISEGLVREPGAEGLSWTSPGASEGAVARRALLLPWVLAVDWLRPASPSSGQRQPCCPCCMVTVRPWRLRVHLPLGPEGVVGSEEARM